MAWLKLIPWSKLPWKLFGTLAMAAALYFCWQEKQQAQGQAKAWHEVITTVNAAVLQQEQERMQANKLAADSLKQSKEDRVKLAKTAEDAKIRAAAKMAALRTELSGEQRSLLDSADVFYHAALQNKDSIIGKLETDNSSLLGRAVRAENSLTDSQRYNGQLQKALLAEQKQHKSIAGYVVGAVGATVAVVALVAK